LFLLISGTSGRHTPRRPIVTETGRLKFLAIQQFLEELHARNGLASMNNTYTKTGYRITHAQWLVNEFDEKLSKYFRCR
jgi:hypothetical protein